MGNSISFTRLARVARQNGYKVTLDTDEVNVYVSLRDEDNTFVLEFNPHTRFEGLLSKMGRYAAKCPQLSELYYALADAY